MSMKYFVTSDPDQERRWQLPLAELVTAIRSRWPEAEIVELDEQSPYLDFTVTEDRLRFSYHPGERYLVFRPQKPFLAVADVILWFIDTMGRDVPAVGFDDVEAEPVPLAPDATREDIARDFLGVNV